VRANRKPGRQPAGEDSRGLPRRSFLGIPAPVAWFLAVAGVAFLLRLIHILQLQHNDPVFLAPKMDALYHHQWAIAIAAGHEFITGAFFRAPLYPCFLGLLYKLSGASMMFARIVQALVGGATCGLVYLLARQLLKPQAPSPKPQAAPKSGFHSSHFTLDSSEAAPCVAGLLMAAYPLAIWYDVELLLEGLLTFFVLLGFVLLLHSRDTDRQWWLPGIAFGLAALTRPNVLAFLAVLPVWLLVEYRRAAWKRLGQIWGVAALVILPVTVRNYVASGQFVPIAWQAGTNFYIGNSPESDGVTAVVPGTRADWWGGFDDVRRLAEEAAGRPLKGAEIDRYWLARGFEFWRKQPGKALGLLARKSFLWFAGFELSNEQDLYSVKRHSFINYLFFSSRFLKFPFGILLPLALAGVWLRRRQWLRLLPLYLFGAAYSLSFIVFFVCSRYRLPIIPFVAVFGAMGLTGLVGRTAKRERGIGIAIALGAFLLFNANFAAAGKPVKEDANHVAAAIALHNQGEDAEALAELQRALESDSGPNVLKLEVILLQNRGDLAGAESAARAAVRLYPLNADAYIALGGVLATAHRLDSAEVYYQAALDRDPYAIQAWKDLGNIAFERKDLAKARYYYEGALKIRPTYTMAMLQLGFCDYYEGKFAEARARWQEILKLDPSFTGAKEALERVK
jgi:4-amino-4-deoxy-L-arabinose transferase-like glycosyltransferase/cytochrome c-type biogenesis protein CcmH/NrfG